MTPASVFRTNFAVFEEHDQLLVRLGMLAERYFTDDPNTCILKLRQLGEALAQHVASRVGLLNSTEESQFDLIRKLQDEGILPREVAQLFDEIHRAGNAASHAVRGDHGTALSSLKISWQIAVWYHRTFKNPQFKSGPFIPAIAPKEESAALRGELERLGQTLQ
jgi:type I restriction enzyme R subunit